MWPCYDSMLLLPGPGAAQFIGRDVVIVSETLLQQGGSSSFYCDAKST